MRNLVPLILSISFLSSCYRPPYNDFEPYNSEKKIPRNANVSSVNHNNLIEKLAKYDIQYISYGDTKTLIIPTDRYYLTNSQKFNQLCYPAFEELVKLIRNYPNSKIVVAGFEDNVGDKIKKQQLSQARSEEMLTFLWANGIKATNLKAQGFGMLMPISSNNSIHGSAQNRRIEIQWQDNSITRKQNCCQQLDK